MAITKVTTDLITALAVTAPKLAANAVTTDKLADNAVTAAKIAAGALGDQVAGITSSASATTIAGTLTSTGTITGTLATAAQTAVTSVGTLTGLTVDNLGINGNTITANSGALNITPAGGSAIVLDGTINIDAGVVTGATSITSTAFVGALTGNVTGNTSGTALTVTQAAQTAITSLGTLTTLTVDDMTLNGSTISDAATLTVDVGGDIHLDADGGTIRFKDGGTTFADFTNNSGDLLIQAKVQDKDIVFYGDDNGTGFTAMTIDMSEGGNVGIGTTTPASYSSYANNLVVYEAGHGGITIATGTGNHASLHFADGTSGDTTYRGYLDYNHADDSLVIGAAGAEKMRIAADGTTTIGRNITPTYDNDQGYPLHIQASTGQQTYLAISVPNANSGDTGVVIGHDGTGTRISNREDDPIIFSRASGETMRIDSSGNVGIGTTSPTFTNTSFKGLEVEVSGDLFPNVRLERVSGSSKTNQAYEMVIGTGGNWHVRNATQATAPLSIATDDAVTISGTLTIGTAEAATIGKAIVMAMVFG